jgi:signal transduction histidine kinase/Flp pilus assembly protein TadD
MIVVLIGCKQSDQTPAPSPQADAGFSKAMDLLNSQPDSAFYYFNEVATQSTDSLEIASALNYMAIIQHNAGDYFGSIETLLAALGYLKEESEDKRPYYQAVYNLLGSNNLTLGNYVDAILYYQQTLELTTDPNFKNVARNNLAVAYQKQGDYAKAIELLTTIQNDTVSNPANLARVQSNLARTRWLQNRDFNPLPDFWSALRIRTTEKDQWGLNASYSHLADYYSQRRTDSALWYASNMYAVATSINSVDDQLEALQKIIPLAAPDKAKRYVTEYMRLSDSLQAARNSARNQFALIRYEAEKSKAENFELLKANAEKELLLFRQQLIGGSLVLALVGLVIFGINRQRKRKEQLQLQFEQSLREQQLKTSQKVHDVVANGLYRIMTTIEHKEELDKNELLDNIEELYEKSRDISYEAPDEIPATESYHQSINDLLKGFASENTRVVIVGNEPDYWNNLHPAAKKNLAQVLQELMVNMRKHSKASLVLIKFGAENQALQITYTDDGIGLPEAAKFGNGLKNTENRIRELKGRISFGQHQPTGLKVEIHLPFAPVYDK